MQPLLLNQKGFLKKNDPRSNLLFFAFFVLIVISKDPQQIDVFIGLTFLLFIGISLSEFSFQFYTNCILSVYPMIFFVSFLLPFSDPELSGKILATISDIHIYQSGFNNFISMNIKMLLIYSSSLLLIKNTDRPGLLRLMEKYKMPFWVITIITFMHRLFYLLGNELERIRTAYNARYQHLTYFKRLKILSGMSIVYLTRIVDRNDRTYLAMNSKGFSGKVVLEKNLNWTTRDTYFTAGFLTYFGILLYVL